LVVLIVDQLGAWVLDARWASLAEDGGFARLRREGLYAPELRYEHATTSTAPGHAALFTGLPPRGSGIFANERLHETSRKVVSILADDETHEVEQSVLEKTSSSAKLLQSPSLADALRAQRPNARIIALSLKDRAAIFGGGRSPDASIWFDAERGRFVTSTAFGSQLPGWALAENTKLPGVLSGSWRALDESWLEQHAPTADAQNGEGDLGAGSHFPYDFSHAEKPGLLFRGTPNADEALLELASGALADGPRERQTLLVVSLSALDYVGHVYGPDSWESWEELRRLDARLGRFLSELEQRGQPFGLMLSADHGSTVLPETAGNERARPWCKLGAKNYFELPCDAGGRLYRDELEQSLRKAAGSALGEGDYIRGVVEPFVYFTSTALALDATRRAKLEQACSVALLGYTQIARVIVSRAMSGPCPAVSDESIDALVCRSLPAGAGELYIVTRPGSFFDPNLARAHGINHGTPYLYDRTVPVLIRAPDGTAAGRTWSGRVRPADFTVTAAALLGIEPPSGAAGGRNLLRASLALGDLGRPDHDRR
jgi:arylsulfatase A-like enzyme